MVHLGLAWLRPGWGKPPARLKGASIPTRGFDLICPIRVLGNHSKR